MCTFEFLKVIVALILKGYFRNIKGNGLINITYSAPIIFLPLFTFVNQLRASTMKFSINKTWH